MKYTNEVTINRSIERVINLFDDPKNIGQWQPNFVSFEHISGVAGQPGAVSHLKYRNGKRENILVETVTVRNLPHEFSGTYEMKGTKCIVRNYFKAVGPNQTLYTSESEWVFGGFIKILAFFMGGHFKKQSQKYMENFKAFVEKS
jgi:hypothetical protein